MDRNKRDVGDYGELLAAIHLEENGFVILERNWRFHHKEIDIIAKDRDDLVVVEVKFRGDPDIYSNSEFVSRKQQYNLFAAANAYIQIKGIDASLRFDLAIVDCDGNLEYIEDAFFPNW